MEQFINFIIRPPRAEYNPKNDLLDQEFTLKGKWYQRKDLEVSNCRGEVLQCSHYMPIGCSEGKALPCVIYCHGNSGCRADGSEAAIILLPLNITVFILDFSGSGLSEGDHVTLGWNEKDDLRAVVDYLRADGNVSLIGLWGRSMGAVTSLMYGAEDPSIAGMVLDSPFSDLVDLMMELVDTYKIRLPKFTVKFAIHYMRRAILKKAKFDITELNTIKVAKSCFVPVLFGHAVEDDFIQPHHSDRIYEAYVFDLKRDLKSCMNLQFDGLLYSDDVPGYMVDLNEYADKFLFRQIEQGDKNIIKFEGDHNSSRPQFYFDSISIFFNNVLQPPVEEVAGAFFDMSHDYFGRGSLSTVHEMRNSDDLLSDTMGPAASSTEDAIKQLRSKRLVSRTEVPSDISSNEQPEAQEGGSSGDPAASSSKMISFELANGNPYGPHVPASIDEDEYVEYQLDNLADFPNNVEEEERMFMVAVLESLKDLEVKHPCVEEPSSNVGNELPEPLPKDDQENYFTTAKSVPLKEEPAQMLAVNGPALAPQVPLPDASKESDATPATTFFYPKAAETKGPSPLSDASVSNQPSSDSNVVDTKATVTVVKNPSNNIMDGLLRRWDLNFFRNR